MTSYGTTYIDISARLDKLDQGLATAVAKAVDYGSRVGKAFGTEMEGSLLSEVQQAAEEAMAALDKEFKSSTEDAKEAGEKAGKAYADGFEKEARAVDMPKVIGGGQQGEEAISSGRRFGNHFFGGIASQWGQGGAAKLGSMFAKQLGPMAVAGFADSLAGFLRSDKSVGDAIEEMLLSIPFVGSFVNLGTAIYEATAGAADKAAEELIAKQAAAREGILAARAAAYKEEEASNRRGDSLRIDAQRLQLAKELRDLTRDAGEEDKIRFRAQAEAIQLERDLQFSLAAEIGDYERRQLEETHAMRLQDIEERAMDEIAALRLRQEKEAEIEAQRAKAEQDRIDREREATEERVRSAQEEVQLAEIRLKALKDGVGATGEAARQIEEAERLATEEIRKQRELRGAQTQEEQEAIERRYEVEGEIARLQASAGSASEKAAKAAEGAATALGSFKFDPYPPREQRNVQERTMRAAERTATALSSSNLGFQ